MSGVWWVVSGVGCVGGGGGGVGGWGGGGAWGVGCARAQRHRHSAQHTAHSTGAGVLEAHLNALGGCSA